MIPKKEIEEIEETVRKLDEEEKDPRTKHVEELRKELSILDRLNWTFRHVPDPDYSKGMKSGFFKLRLKAKEGGENYFWKDDGFVCSCWNAEVFRIDQLQSLRVFFRCGTGGRPYVIGEIGQPDADVEIVWVEQIEEEIPNGRKRMSGPCRLARAAIVHLLAEIRRDRTVLDEIAERDVMDALEKIDLVQEMLDRR